MIAEADAKQAQARTAAAVDAIRAEVERVPTAQGGGDVERALAEVRRQLEVQAHWGITPSWPVLGRVEVLGKRAMRILLRWYINPIVEQQNAYNLAVLAALHELEAQIHAITRNMHQASVNKQQRDAQ